MKTPPSNGPTHYTSGHYICWHAKMDFWRPFEEELMNCARNGRTCAMRLTRPGQRELWARVTMQIAG